MPYTVRYSEGRPGIACPENRNDSTVKLSQGDLMLCPACEVFRFPYLAKSKPVSSNSSLPSNSPAMVQPDDSVSDLVNSIDKKLVVNELLYFVSNRIDSTPVDKLKTVISDFYREDEILSAKTVLIQNIADLKALGVSAFTKKRIGDNKAKASVDDIFSILETADSKNMFDSLPVFCAASPKRIPALPDEMTDLAVVKMDICHLKNQMSSMNDKLDSLFAVVDSLSQSVGHSVQQISHDIRYHCQTLSDRMLSVENMISQTDVSHNKEDISRDPNMPEQSERVSVLPNQSAVCDNPTQFTLPGDGVNQSGPEHRGIDDSSDDSQGRSQPVFADLAKACTADDFQEVKKRIRAKDKKKMFVVGGSDSVDCFKGVAKKLVICVNRIELDVTTDKMTEFLQSKGISVFSCFLVKPQTSDASNLRYVAMRICVPDTFTKIIFDANTWPTGVTVRPWVFKERTQ